MREALRLEPRSVKDLYRLGVFEAQVESRHNRPALRAFVAAIESYRSLSEDERQRRGDLRKPYVRSLYGAARSALRLDDLARARRFSFDCIREDDGTDHVAPVHKLYLAAKICAALGRTEDAERGYRKALAAKGPPERDYVHAGLAALALGAGRAEDAERWIDGNIPPHRRKPVLWRLVGDVRVARGHGREALLAYQNALRNDRAGRHLTLTAMGSLEIASGRAQQAATAFRQANDFRRRKYLSEHLPALDGLATALALLGREVEAADVRGRAESLREQSKGQRAAGGPGIAVARPPSDDVAAPDGREEGPSAARSADGSGSVDKARRGA
jgi:tetratricopeptide (TPR) repeat protein